MTLERSWCDAPTSRTLRTFVDRKPTMRKLGSRIAIAGVATGAAVVMGSGVAYAYWSATGTGSGAAATGSASAMTVTVSGITGLYPLQKTTVPVLVTNTNAFPVTLSNVHLDSVAPTGSGCAAGDISLDATAAGVSGAHYSASNALTKAGGAAPSVTLNVPISVGDLANACQGSGHSFAVTFTVSGQSSS